MTGINLEQLTIAELRLSLAACNDKVLNFIITMADRELESRRDKRKMESKESPDPKPPFVWGIMTMESKE